MTADGLGADGLAHGGGVYLEQPGNTTLQDEVLDVCIHLAAMRANSYPGTDSVDLTVVRTSTIAQCIMMLLFVLCMTDVIPETEEAYTIAKYSPEHLQGTY